MYVEYVCTPAIYVHLVRRRALLASYTVEPNETRITRQAGNLTWRLEADGIKLGVVVHDRDKQFARRADKVFKSEGARVMLTPLVALERTRIANAGSVAAAPNAWIGC